MKRLQVTTTVFLTVYSLTVIFTDLSLTGYWTDVIFSVCLLVFALIVVYRKRTDKRWLTISLRTTTLVFSIFAFGLIVINLINPISWDIFQMRHFKNEIVNDRHFNAYFKPVGAYGRGYGSFWITESPKYFPFIEWKVYSENATDYDFSLNYFEETPIENVVKSIIENKVMKK